MKRLLAVIVLVLASAAHSQTVSSYSAALTYFADNSAFVSVIRSTDTNGVVTTQLEYSFCLQIIPSTCRQGAGNIPNADFTGTATGRFVLAVDTSTVPGFQNLVCDQAGLGGCIDGTAVPAPGGVIRLTFVKTNLYGYTTIGTSIYHYGPARIVANGRFSNYSAESTGNVFEVAVNQDKFAQTVRFTTH